MEPSKTPQARQTPQDNLELVFGDSKTENPQKIKITKNASSVNGLYYADEIITRETEQDILQFINQLDKDAWRCNKGKSPSVKGANPIQITYGRLTNEKPIPDILKRAAEEAITSLKNSEIQPPGISKFIPETLTLSRYKIGEGRGMHYDPPRASPFVLGITIAANRVMTWTRDKPKQRQKLDTKARSAYVMTGDSFTKWKHGHEKTKKQPKIVYSLTFRMLRKI